MRKPEDQEIKAFDRLSRTTDGAIFVNYLEECLLKQDSKNRIAELDRVQIGQGKSQNLADLIKYLS